VGCLGWASDRPTPEGGRRQVKLAGLPPSTYFRRTCPPRKSGTWIGCGQAVTARDLAQRWRRRRTPPTLTLRIIVLRSSPSEPARRRFPDASRTFCSAAQRRAGRPLIGLRRGSAGPDGGAARPRGGASRRTE